MVTRTGLILDVSVAAKWYLRDEDLLDQADDVLTRYGDGSLALTAPSYLMDEAGNILRSAVQRGRIAPGQARRNFADLIELDLTLIEPTAMRRTAALELALAHGIAFYDALYLQVAQELNLPLLTADRPFYDRIAAAFSTAIFLGAWR